MLYFKHHILKTSGQEETVFFLSSSLVRYRLAECMDIAILC